MVTCSCPPVAFWPESSPLALHVGHSCAAYRQPGEEVGEGWRVKDTGKRWGPVPSMTLEEGAAGKGGAV